MSIEPAKTMIAVAATAAALTSACEKTVAVAPPPPEVYVVSVVQKDVPTYLDLVGQTEGTQDVDVRARVEGFLDTMNFREGSFVRRGALLYTIDPKPFEAALAQAKADQATAQARLQKANNDVARYTPLVAKQAVSQQELDNARAAQDAGRSEVDAAKAAVEKAALDLSYTRVNCPVDGLVGLTKVKPGSLVGRGESTLLTTVSQINPIVLRVGATEADYLRVAKRSPGRSGEAPNAGGIELTLADGTVHPQHGTVTTVERAVNASTGTLTVQISFPNPDNVLRPGQYGRARILIDMKKSALLIPQRAVQELQSLYSVAVVGADNKVAFRNVKVGPRVDTLWVIEEGLTPSDQVVAEGLQALRDGITVRTKPMPPPSATAPAAAPIAEAR
ncbi:MAG TPA: efflux RND transporter periplasmic adaptor subunit [Vicinamibacterales bacterium]|nr:efflux RND transporter periplasmic adaptor subunit [Vicinamibacterales bacterium]